LPKAGNVQVLNGVSGLLDAGFDLHTTCIKWPKAEKLQEALKELQSWS
jgi:hypothetical protein